MTHPASARNSQSGHEFLVENNQRLIQNFETDSARTHTHFNGISTLMTNQNRQNLLLRGASWLSLKLMAVIVIALSLGLASPSTAAQDWQTGVSTPDTTTLLPKTDAAPQVQQPGDAKPITLVALLTEQGQRIDQGLIWRVYRFDEPNRNGTLLQTLREPQPKLFLKNGRYMINVSFGRAYVTREIAVTNDAAKYEKRFVLNAGGLRVKVLLGSDVITDKRAVRYDIFTDRDQLDNRTLVLADVKPGLIVRLNSGIYHIVSKYGDANATIASDVTVEPAKLTEATFTHSAAKVRFKLVTRSGGEALPDTQWRIKTSNGDLVKKSVGALPTHILAPGSYTVVGVSDGKAYEREFTVSDGTMIDVEVLKR